MGMVNDRLVLWLSIRVILLSSCPCTISSGKREMRKRIERENEGEEKREREKGAESGLH